MLRTATAADLPAILAIGDNPGEAPLSDPGTLSEADCTGLIKDGVVWVWQAPGEPLAGFAAIDAAAGTITALLVKPGHESRGIGRALLAAACDALRAAGCNTAMITLEPGNPAERHYLRAGWSVTGINDDKVVLRLLL